MRHLVILVSLASLLCAPTLAEAQLADGLGAPNEAEQERERLLREIRARNAARRAHSTELALRTEVPRAIPPRRGPHLAGPIALTIGGVSAAALGIAVGALIQSVGNAFVDATTCSITLYTRCESSAPDHTWMAVPAAIGGAVLIAGLTWLGFELSAPSNTPAPLSLLPSLELDANGATLGLQGRF